MNVVAVTGVGGGVGQSILKSLAGSQYVVIGMDSDFLAAGLYTTSKSFLIPDAESIDYISRLLEICKDEKVSLLFPGLDAELMVLAKNRERFKAIGTTVIVSEERVIEISNDKMETYNSLKALGVNVPSTWPLDEFTKKDCVFPLIIKQRVGGARSKNVFLAHNEHDFDVALSQIRVDRSNIIVQEYIEGEEYTCGTVNLEGLCKAVIIMRRLLRDGDTYKCFTENNSVIEDTVMKTVASIKPFGACNVQLRMKNGVPWIFEINARCSGTTASRTLCGFNEPRLIADFLLRGIEPSVEVQEKTILRYWDEIVVENSLVEKLRSSKMISKKSKPVAEFSCNGLQPIKGDK